MVAKEEILVERGLFFIDRDRAVKLTDRLKGSKKVNFLVESNNESNNFEKFVYYKVRSAIFSTKNQGFIKHVEVDYDYKNRFQCSHLKRKIINFC